MKTPSRLCAIDRRAVLKGAAAIATLPVASPFIIEARGETPLRIGMVDPLTGVYAALATGGVFVDVKSVVTRDQIPQGIHYWSL